MQRKLSEIAEIPKILSSTLATVSQTFDKLMPTDAMQLKQLVQQRRKYSYDEDAIDYELSDKNANDGDDGDADGAAKQCRKYAKVKEITPESDYASETNYTENEEEIFTEEDDVDDDDDVADDDDVDDDGVDDDDDDDDDYDDSDCEAYYIDGNDATVIVSGGAAENEDFLTTSYTWNLRNIPKLKINDELDQDADDFKKKSHESLKEQTPTPEDTGVKQDKQEKLDKLERSWPWADREKIIYKQSTCHLVPRKPLGLVEKRIQLLAKQHLEDNLQQIEKK